VKITSVGGSKMNIWTPKSDKKENSQVSVFLKEVEQENSLSLQKYQSLWKWSIEHKEDFWSKLWDFCSVIGDKGEEVFKSAEKMQDCEFFPDSKINFAENLLRRRDDEVALVFKGEDKASRELTYKELYNQVSQIRQALLDVGITEGDRVTGYLPNMPETIIAMLAATSLGAIWSSASPDFGVQGVLDRFGQIEPKVLFAVDGYYYNGKEIDCRDKIKQIQKQLPSLQKTVIVQYLKSDINDINAENFDSFKYDYDAEEIVFERFDFNNPLYIMFSSGTTGIPKSIVHGAGGTLLQHLKEHKLQCDIKKDDKVFYFTTCGWMMWNWLVTALASEATLLLYDGSPFYPSGEVLWQYAEKYRASLFGTSAKYIDALNVNNIKPKDNFDLSNIKMLTSTGSPLTHEGFDYIYKNIKEDIHIASISGGTDIVSCFILGNPISPVYRGEIQCAGLGMDIDIFNENGEPVCEEKGELVCKTPFPSMPVSFWNDKNGDRYFKAYFDKFSGVWCHGDWCEKTKNDGFIIYGRSDATLNPGGVRIGTAEIYRIVEQLPEVIESIVVGQSWNNDIRVVLFAIVAESIKLNDDLKDKIKKAIRSGATPRHVPSKIIEVTDIPRTKSGKITEIAVRDIIHGKEIKNKEALANPEALEEYKNLKELED